MIHTAYDAAACPANSDRIGRKSFVSRQCAEQRVTEIPAFHPGYTLFFDRQINTGKTFNKMRRGRAVQAEVSQFAAPQIKIIAFPLFSPGIKFDSLIFIDRFAGTIAYTQFALVAYFANADRIRFQLSISKYAAQPLPGTEIVR